MTAQTGFQQDHIAFLSSKLFKCHHSDDLKKGWRLVGWKVTKQGLHAFGETHDVRLRHKVPIDLDSFAKADEMRRSEEAGLVSSTPIDALKHGANGAFSVGAGDVNDIQLVVRIPSMRGELPWIFQSQLRAE